MPRGSLLLAPLWPLTFSSGERPRALWALLFYLFYYYLFLVLWFFGGWGSNFYNNISSLFSSGQLKDIVAVKRAQARIQLQRMATDEREKRGGYKMCRLTSCVVCKLFYLNIFSSETTHWILTKLHGNDPWVVPYQICSNRSSWLHK